MDPKKCEKLWEAATEGNLPLVQQLSEEPSVNLNWQDNKELRTPFYRACGHGKIQAVRFMLELPGLLVNLQQKQGATPFSIACQNGHVVVVSLLLSDKRVEVNKPLGDETTPFFVACSQGHVGVISLLLAAQRVEVNQPNINGATPFYVACQSGHMDVVSLLLADPRIEVNKPDMSGATPFFIACQNDRQDVVSLLLANQRIDVNKPKENRFTPFYIACSKGHSKVVLLLLFVPRVDINKPREDGSTPLWIASQNGHLFVVRRILASGREVDIKKESSFNSTTAAEQARLNGARYFQADNETEEEFDRRAEYCKPIVELIDSFEKDPSTTRALLRMELEIENQWIEEHLGIPVSFCAKIFPPESRDPQQVKVLRLIDCSLSSIPSAIENFTNLTEIDLSRNPLDDSSAKMISKLLKNLKQLKSLNLSSTKLGRKGMLRVIQALVWNFSQGNFNLKSLEVDGMKLDSFGRLEIIPIDILRLGSVKIVRYLLDLYQSPEADPLFRSKLMVVGFAEIGKTSLLECLFPLTGILLIKDVKKKIFKKGQVLTDCYVKLIGNNLTQSEVPRFHNHTRDPKKTVQYFGTIYLGSEKNGWSIERIDGEEQPGFRILGTKGGFESELYCTDRIEREKWFVRIDELLKRNRTHGIDIREIDISSHPAVKKHFQEKEMAREDQGNAKGKGKGAGKVKVELSVWDFAGQHEYYNNHQHFLSTRSVFLVLWNVTEFNEMEDVAAAQQEKIYLHGRSLGRKPQQGKGIQGLEFWLWSLSFHLNKQLQQEGLGESYDARDYFKIIVIGTHFDRLEVKDQNKMGIRKSVVEKLCEKYGLRLEPENYLEVSCVDNLMNIGELQDRVFGETVRMKYMGERIPLDYLFVESKIGHLLVQHRDYPIVDIKIFYEHYPERIVRDALSLLHEWGKCVYFGNDERLKDQVVLDPHFLSKITLAGFFRLGKEADEKRKNGVIHHSDLKTFWAEAYSPAPSPSKTFSIFFVIPPSLAPLINRGDFWEIAEVLMSFMEKFDVCFVLPEDKGNPFKEQRSLLPSLLPLRRSERVIRTDLVMLKGPIEITRDKIQDLTTEYETNKRLLEQKALSKVGISNFKALEKELNNEKGKLVELERSEKELESELVGAQPWKVYWGDELGMGQIIQFERVFQFGNIPAELISRMLARLHGMIQGGCVMRDCVLLRNNADDDKITQAKVTVDLSFDQFVIEIRSGSLELGEKMLKEIRESISKVLELHPQLTVPAYSFSVDPDGDQRQEEKGEVVIESQLVEGVRSPFSGRIIPLEMIKEAMGKDSVIMDNEWEISVLKLKEMAGLTAPKPLVKKQIHQGDLEWGELVKMFTGLGGKEDQIQQAYEIEDSEYRSMFEGNRKLLSRQHRNAPEKFQKQDHKSLSNPGLREEYLRLLRRKQQNFESSLPKGNSSEDEKTGVLPMIHGTNESIGWKIAQGGFGIVASLDDGYYGQGIYFTSKVEYAQHYAGAEKPVLVISMVNPGNVFPVIEHPNKSGSLMGGKCKLGYQSHYCVTGKGFHPTDKVEENSNDELVVFERAQALPKFMVFFQ